MTSYTTDVKALLDKAKSVLSLSDNDVADIGAVDPELYDEQQLTGGGDTEVWIAFTRFGVKEAYVNANKLFFSEYAINVRCHRRSAFADCLSRTETLRDALAGWQYQKGTVVRTVDVGDGFPRLDDNADIKMIQFFVSII